MAKRKPNADKNKRLIIIISAAILLLLCAIVVVVLVGGRDPQSPSLDTDGTDAADTAAADTTASEPEPEPEPIMFPEPTFSHGDAFSFERVNAPAKPQYLDPYTGLEVSRDLSSTRPVAIMINNIQYAIPQVGISKADILYECLAEGGITRLLMITRDYESLDVVGSIRSSREYYIDFAKSHDAIYVHAGGSTEAYSQIYSRNIAHLDGVKADARTGKNVSGTVFYRDPERLKTMAYEHTLVTTGQRITEGISTMGYNTTTDAADPIKPIDWGWRVALSGDDATHVKVPYRNTQTPEYEYDAASGKYLRYQFAHEAHVDGATGEQLAFENIIILNMHHRNTGDSAGHLVVTTTGSGDGWFVTGGKRIPIKWYKETQDSVMKLTDTEGNAIVVNRGKTVINVVDGSVYPSVTFN